MGYKKSNQIIILTVVLAANLVALAWFGWSSYNSYAAFQMTGKRQMKAEQLHGIIVHLDEVLTMSARMAASTGDLKWEDRYREFEPKLDATIKEAMALWPGAYLNESTAKTDTANSKLVDMENQAFDLIRQGNSDSAVSVLFGDEYQLQKRIYSDGMADFDAVIAEAAISDVERAERAITLNTTIVILLSPLLILTWITVNRVNRRYLKVQTHNNLLLAQQADELAKLNKNLDHKVTERTRELELSRQVAIRARQAAEAANKSLTAEITERWHVEKELRKKSDQMRTMADSLPGLISFVDNQRRYRFNNKTYEDWFGRPYSEMIGKPVVEILGEKTYGAIENKITAALSGEKVCFECEFPCINGSTRYADASLVPHFDENGKVLGYFSLVTDITERKKAERERQMLEVETNQARKLEAVGSLAAGIAHEINTPIQFVGDNTEFLADSFETLQSLIESYESLWQMAKAGEDMESLDSEKVKAEESADYEYIKGEIPTAIEQTLDGVRRVAKIVRAMKNFSHSDQGEKSTANINDMLLTTLTVSHNELKYVADVETHLDPELSNVMCYRDDLNQVFLNLLVNAAHTIADVVCGAPGGKGVITVSTSRNNDDVIIKISDTGKGIPQSIQDRVFDPFFSTKDVGKGSGQGLSIARKIIVEKHEGSLDFETEEGKGTTFIIRLPLSIHEATVGAA